MIDTKALRQKILDLAIRGKLVPQDPDDEPASVLLERIRQQKQQMVKEGKLKPKDIKNDSVIFVGEDNLHYEKFADGSVKCIEDEIPFDLPEGWAWVRLVSLIEAFITGPFGSALHKSDYVADGIPLINPMNITDGKVIPIDKMQVSPETAERLSSFKVAPSDIVIARRGDMGRCAVVQPAQKGWLCGTGSFILRFPAVLCSEYFAVCLRSPYSVELMSGNSIGNTMLNLNQTILKSILIPVPPCTEQNRIINAIFDADALLAEIANQSESLVMCVAKAKSKILDLAIRGQLVPQDPNDEPASVLLERIRAEKEELIKQGKIKRDKKESVIFRGEDNSYYEKVGSDVICIDAEIPFEIPDTWEWMRLESCCIKEIRRGKSPTYIDESGTLVFAQKCNTRYSGIDVGLALFLDESILGRYPNDEYMQDGDVVINSTGTGTLGRVGIYHTTDNHRGLPIVPDSHVTVIRAAHSIQSIYVYAFMKANQSKLEKEGEGSTNQKELKPLTLKEMLIPMPPYSEQERIAAAITAAFSTISAMEKSLN